MFFIKYILKHIFPDPNKPLCCGIQQLNRDFNFRQRIKHTVEKKECFFLFDHRLQTKGG